MDRIEFTKPQGQEYPGQDGRFAPDVKKRKIWLIIAILLVLVILAGCGVSFVLSHDDSNYAYGGGDSYIGTLYVEGIISGENRNTDTYQHEFLLSNIDYMMKDSQNKGMMIYVNSPGGTVYHADELYLKIMEYKKKTSRPVHAYFGETAASGGYYAVAGADRISAGRNSTTGSIGVYSGPFLDASGLLQKLGVKADFIKSGANKAMGNGYEPMTDYQKAILQTHVDEAYEQFVQVVAEGRRMTIEAVKMLADGRTYTATQAKRDGLIDGICSFTDAKRAMLIETGLDCGFINIKYAPKKTFMSSLLEISESAEGMIPSSQASELESVMKVIDEHNSSELMYLAH